MDLSKLFIFEGLSKTQTEKIISDFPNAKKYKKGEIIYSESDFKNALGFIIKGKATAVSNNSRNTLLQSFCENMCFGAASLFGKTDIYVSTVTAKTDMEILFLSENRLKEIFKEYPQTALNYIAFLSDKIRFLNTKLRIISSMGAEDMVLTYLKSIVNSDGVATIPQNMTSVAKTLGLSRASLYRVLETLTENGKIIKNNNEIRLVK